MSASCMLQSQYIESRGPTGKPGVRLEMKTTSDKYCSIISGRGGLCVFSDVLSFANIGVGSDE